METPNLNGHVNISVMVTYVRIFFSGPYGDTHVKQQTKRLGFWDGEKFHVPPGWTWFRMSSEECLVPNGWGGDHMTPDQIISWTETTEKDLKPVQYSNRAS